MGVMSVDADLQIETKSVAGLWDLFCVVFCTETANLQKFTGLTIFVGSARVALSYP
jgi:hypothetical protein